MDCGVAERLNISMILQLNLNQHSDIFPSETFSVKPTFMLFALTTGGARVQ